MGCGITAAATRPFYTDFIGGYGVKMFLDSVQVLTHYSTCCVFVCVCVCGGGGRLT